MEPSAPDGKRRAAWAALVMFVDLNDGTWDPDPPDVDDAVEAMLAIAGGDVDGPGLRRGRENASGSTNQPEP